MAQCFVGKDWHNLQRCRVFVCVFGVPTFHRGNEIIERFHRTIKRLAARTRCSTQEAVYWHNVMPKDDETVSTAPAKLTYAYKIRLKGIDAVLLQEDTIYSPYITGDAVWIKSPHRRCTTQFDRGTVTRICNPHSVCVDGIPRHMKDVRAIHGKDNTTCDHVTSLDPSDDEADPMVYEAAEENSSASWVLVGLRQDEFSDTSEDNVTEETESVPLRWSSKQEPEICTPWSNKWTNTIETEWLEKATCSILSYMWSLDQGGVWWSWAG